MAQHSLLTSGMLRAVTIRPMWELLLACPCRKILRYEDQIRLDCPRDSTKGRQNLPVAVAVNQAVSILRTVRGFDEI